MNQCKKILPHPGKPRSWVWESLDSTCMNPIPVLIWIWLSVKYAERNIRRKVGMPIYCNHNTFLFLFIHLLFIYFSVHVCCIVPVPHFSSRKKGRRLGMSCLSTNWYAYVLQHQFVSCSLHCYRHCHAYRTSFAFGLFIVTFIVFYADTFSISH